MKKASAVVPAAHRIDYRNPSRDHPPAVQQYDGMRLTAVAALVVALTPSAEIQLLPAGEFRARDGRPAGVGTWKIDAAIAQRLIALAGQRETPLVIDYEHQTLHAEQNGMPAPAAGWFKTLEWREGQGLYATDVEWTDKARAMIEAGEYKYISPVFSYDKATGAVRELLLAAITNNPALDGMDAVAQRAAARFALIDQPQETRMPELLKKLLAGLGLQETATEAQAEAALTALKESAGKVGALETEVAALKSAAPDPAKFVPIDSVKDLQKQVAILTAQQLQRELDELIKPALDDGRLLPAQEKWARELGGKDLASLKSYLDDAQPIAALRATQTGGKPPAGNKGQGGDDADALAEAALKYKADQAAAGKTVTIVQAVNHVNKGA